MFHLVFISAFIYDVLCNLFYFAALGYYVAVRERGNLLRPLQLVAWLALYISALNAKEMAVTLPALIITYELLRHYHGSEQQSFFRWIGCNASPALAAGLIAAIYSYNRLSVIYSYNKIHGLHGGFEAYTPHYSWDAFTASNARFLSDLFYLSPHHILSGQALLAVWGVVFLYAFLRRDRMLQLMAFWVVITPLPLAFVSLRAPACLSIVLFAWAMILSKLVSDLAMAVARWLRLRAAPALLTRVGMTLCVAILLGLFTERQNRGLSRLHLGEQIAQVIDAFHALNLRPKPGSKILLQNNPLGKRPFPVYIAQLVWNDHSLIVYQDGYSDLSGQEMESIDYVLGISTDKIDVIRLPR